VTKGNTRLDLLAALSGILIAMQARANGELSHRMGNSIEAALVSFGSGLILISIISIFTPSIRKGMKNLKTAVNRKEIPVWTLFAGMLGGSFVAVQTQIVPIVGVAIYSVASIAGQTATSLLVDRIGLTGGGKKQITAKRVTAAGVTVLAVLVSVFDRIDAQNLSLFAVLFGCFAGCIVGVQRALNGQINESTKQSFATSWLNFIMGTTFLFIFLSIGVLINRSELVPLPAGPWWMYMGGVLSFTLISVGGQLVGSLLIDLYSPTEGVQISAYLVTGIVMTYLGVVVGGVGSLPKLRSKKQ